MDVSTAADIINDAAVELGLIKADMDDPFDSEDQNIILLCRLLKRVGRNLVRQFGWSQLTKEHNFTTDGAASSFDLPADYARMKHQSHWNRTTVEPLGGPVNSRDWQELKARTVAGALIMPFRIQGNRLHVYPTPATGQTIYYEYISKRWVLPVLGAPTAPTLSEPSLGTDSLWFDEPLLLAELKLAFLKAKFFDTTAAQATRDEIFAAVTGGDGAAPVLSVVGSGGMFRLVDMDNIPDTGMGD